MRRLKFAIITTLLSSPYTAVIHERNGHGFKPLAIDSTPGYFDTEPFPAVPTKWTYRAIYRVGDQRVGQWSKPLSVTMGGQPTGGRCLFDSA